MPLKKALLGIDGTDVFMSPIASDLDSGLCSPNVWQLNPNLIQTWENVRHTETTCRETLWYDNDQHLWCLMIKPLNDQHAEVGIAATHRCTWFRPHTPKQAWTRETAV